MTRIQPCFQVAVKIATVVAARPKASLTLAAVASKAAWAGLVWAPWLARPAAAVPRWASGLRSAGGRGRVPACSQLSGGRRADPG